MQALKNLCIVAALSASLAACAPQTAAIDPNFNLGDAKVKLLAYEKSGHYMADVGRADSTALDYIRATAPTVKKPAILLDIDETSLSNWPELAVNNLAFKLEGPCDDLKKGPCGLTPWQQRAEARGIAPTVQLANEAQKLGVTVFFLTGRDETVRQATEKNLAAAGYRDWKELILRPAHSKTPSAADYKAPQRARIEKMGYTIIANLGDQPSDLTGGHALRSFLLPNPFYRIP